VPFAGGGETEQAFRAQRLHQRGYALTLDEAVLTPPALAEVIDRASTMTPSTETIDLEGAKNSAKYIVDALASGPGC
jgi:predicted glycosyltransferase